MSKKTAVKQIMNWILNNSVFTQTTTLDGEINIHLLLDKKEMKKMFDKHLALENQQIINAVTFGQNNNTVSLNKDKIIAEQYYKETYE